MMDGDTRLRGGCCGICVQDWVATDHSNGPHRGNVYVVSSRGCVAEYTQDQDIVCVRSTDGGATWDPPRRVNDEPADAQAGHVFPAMSVAPNGRVDVVWVDNRENLLERLVAVLYSYSIDGGETWSKNRPVSPMFDSYVGWPARQRKIGDYYDMISDNAVANVAYAATFNGEQDVYFLRVGDCNDNGIHDSDDLADGTAYDCNENALLDECEPGDLDGNEQINLRDFAGFANCYTGSSGPNGRRNGRFPRNQTNFGGVHGARESARAEPRGSGVGTSARAEPRGSGWVDATRTSYVDPCCGIMDFDHDGDVDLTDFTVFHEAFTR